MAFIFIDNCFAHDAILIFDGSIDFKWLHVNSTIGEAQEKRGAFLTARKNFNPSGGLALLAAAGSAVD
jgi:hypothetical protein